MKERSGPPRILTPEDVRNAQFGTTRMRTGYDMDDVDDFLDQVESSLAVLLAELRRVQDAELLLRQQFEQLQARSGASPYTSTAVQRPLMPSAMGPGGSADVAAAVAQAAAVRQGLITQLRAHVADVNAQIQAVASALPSATETGASAMATTPISTASPPTGAGTTGAAPRANPAAQSPQATPARSAAPSAGGQRSTDATGPLPTWSAPTQEIPRLDD